MALYGTVPPFLDPGIPIDIMNDKLHHVHHRCPGLEMISLGMFWDSARPFCGPSSVSLRKALDPLWFLGAVEYSGETG